MLKKLLNFLKNGLQKSHKTTFSNYLIADIHCHPSMRPFNRSLPKGINNPDTTSKESIWYYDPPKFVDKVAQKYLSLAKYSQSNFTAMAKGGVKLISCSLYALEKGFIENELSKIGGEDLAAGATSITTGIPIVDLKYILNNKNYTYYDNLCKEYNYIMQLNNKEVKLVNGEVWKYRVVNDFESLSAALQEENTLAVVINIEGGHNFADRVLSKDEPLDATYEEAMLNHLKAVKNWEYHPFYITVVHHFYNGISGNTKSFPPGMASKNLDQSYMLGTDMTEFGEKFIDLMLDNSNGKRILVDAKHLSIRGRIRYYELLNTKYKNENIPILYTHAGVNGRKSIYEVYNIGIHQDWKPSEYCQNIPLLPNSMAEKFNAWCINIFDDEIVLIGKSGGLIGIEFDRRIAGLDHDGEKPKSKKLAIKQWADLIWNNIEHIAVTLDNENLNAWDNICIGSDFDGIINSIYGIWTEEEMPEYKDFLVENVTQFMANFTLKSQNELPIEIIVDKIMHRNLLEFYEKNLNTAKIEIVA